MKNKLCLITSMAALAVASQTHAQGLLSIGARDDFHTKMPFALIVGAGVGWDSNPDAVSEGEEDSMYLTGNIMAMYNTGDKRTAYAASASYSPIYYFDKTGSGEDFFHNARVSLNYRNRINRQTTITESFYLSYEIEPNYDIGATVARRNDQYLYGYNSLAIAHAWNRRFSTVTSWTISGVAYDDDEFSDEDSLTNMFAHEFRYALSRTTTAALTYRFAVTEYENGFGDYTSHYALVGLDHQFNPRLVGSFRVGAELRDRDNGGSETSPYAETSLTYRVRRQTSFRWYQRYGFEDSNIGVSTERTSYRTGLSLDHVLTSRLTSSFGLHYIHDDFEGPTNFEEDTLAVSVGFDYALYKNVSLNGGYSFTTGDADDGGDFDRHMVTLGVGARF